MRLYDYDASGNCLKVRLLLGLLDRPYERVPIDIFGGDTLTPAFAALNPVRETPVLELDAGETVTQSTAILWLCAEGTPFLPSTALDRARVVQWLAFEQERIMVGIGGARFRRLTDREQLDPALIAARVELGRVSLGVLDGHLADREFVVGSRCTIADLALYGYGHVAPDAGIALAGYPAVRRWLDRLEALPRFVNDLAPYPPNARLGAGRSIYD